MLCLLSFLMLVAIFVGFAPSALAAENTATHGYVENIWFKNTGSTGTYDFTFDSNKSEYDLWLEEGQKGVQLVMYFDFSSSNAESIFFKVLKTVPLAKHSRRRALFIKQF